MDFGTNFCFSFRCTDGCMKSTTGWNKCKRVRWLCLWEVSVLREQFNKTCKETEHGISTLRFLHFFFCWKQLWRRIEARLTSFLIIFRNWFYRSWRYDLEAARANTIRCLRMSTNNVQALFACSRCFSRHPFEELSPGQQLCKVYFVDYNSFIRIYAWKFVLQRDVSKRLFRFVETDC